MKWYPLEVIRKGRWWFFWNFVLKGKALRFSVWSDHPGEVKIDAIDATLVKK